VHISELADRFIKDPSEVVKVQQKVTVTVLEVDRERKRIGLSMRTGPREKPERVENQPAAARPPQKRPADKNKKPQAKAAEKQPFHNPLAEALAKLNRDGKKGAGR
jgi:uncharacterized protein